MHTRDLRANSASTGRWTCRKVGVELPNVRLLACAASMGWDKEGAPLTSSSTDPSPLTPSPSALSPPSPPLYSLFSLVRRLDPFVCRYLADLTVNFTPGESSLDCHFCSQHSRWLCYHGYQRVRSTSSLNERSRRVPSRVSESHGVFVEVVHTFRLL